MKMSLALCLLLSASVAGFLSAQPTIPRVLAVRIENADKNPVFPDTTGLEFQVTLRGITRDDRSHDFGLFYFENSIFAKINLGNFGIQWEPGDTVSVSFTRQDTVFSMGFGEIVLPEGTNVIWWGRQSTKEKDYPGNPVRLYPVVLHVDAPSTGTVIYKDSRDTGILIENPILLKTKNDITGVFSLAPPPAGWRWEPSNYVLTTRDFQFTESAYTDADGVARPGWARTLEFRLVPSDPEG